MNLDGTLALADGGHVFVFGVASRLRNQSAKSHAARNMSCRILGFTANLTLLPEYSVPRLLLMTCMKITI
jgi:hypothetical protein